jgi:hypothetical protein
MDEATEDEVTVDGTTRRRFARATAVAVGALGLPGLATADHDNRSEQGEHNGNDDGAHGNGNGRGRGDDDDPGNSGEHRRDDENRDDRDEEDDGDDGDEDGDGNDGDDGDNGGGGGGGGGDDGRGDDENAQVTARREKDSSVFVLPEGPGTDTAQFDPVVEQASQSVLIRDQFPDDWRVLKESDPNKTSTEGDTRFVEFTNQVKTGETGERRTYFADVPDNTGVDEFGPIEYSVDGETWTEISGTTEEILVAASGTSV